jgi:hypothetical protein
LPTKSIRKSGLFVTFIGGCLLVLALLGLHAHSRIRDDAAPHARNLALVGDLGLTDLCLFTEARYTRNPSQADAHAPFQDHPMALEHFPAGSLASPPGRR